MVIAGKGVGSLSSANALINRNIPFISSITILDGSDDISERELDSYIGLWSPCLKVLKKYNIDFDNKICYVKKSGYKSTEGNWLAQPFKGLTSSYNNGPSLGFMKKRDLLNIMTNPLLISSSSNISIVKEKYINIEKNDNNIIIKTNNGNSYDANLLILADGMNSNFTSTKSSINHLKYRGYEVYRGNYYTLYYWYYYFFTLFFNKGHTSSKFHFAYKERISEDAFQTWGPGIRFATVPTNEGNAWFLAINKSKANNTDTMKGFHRVVNDEEIKKLIETVKDWHRPIQDLIMNTDKHSVIVCDAYGSYHPSNRLSIPLMNNNGGIVYLGDASYTLDPILAQGSGLAIEHGYLLAKALLTNKSNNWNQTLKHFDAMRIERQLRLHYLSDISQFIGTINNKNLINIRNKILNELYTRFPIVGKSFDKIIEISTNNQYIEP